MASRRTTQNLTRLKHRIPSSSQDGHGGWGFWRGTAMMSNEDKEMEEDRKPKAKEMDDNTKPKSMEVASNHPNDLYLHFPFNWPWPKATWKGRACPDIQPRQCHWVWREGSPSPPLSHSPIWWCCEPLVWSRHLQQSWQHNMGWTIWMTHFMQRERPGWTLGRCRIWLACKSCWWHQFNFDSAKVEIKCPKYFQKVKNNPILGETDSVGTFYQTSNLPTNDGDKGIPALRPEGTLLGMLTHSQWSGLCRKWNVGC